jgi:phytanoyl-CoA hydroxylase
MCPKQGMHPLGRARGGEGYLEIPPESLAEHVDSAVDVLLEPGDVLFFKPGTIHSGHPNVGEGVRWSVEFKFQDAEKLTLRDGAEGDIARSLKQPRGVVLDGAQWASLPLHRGARALGYAVPRQPKLSGSSGALAVLNAQDVALARLNTEGYAVIRGMLPQETVAAARGVCETIVDGLAAKLLAEGKIADLMEGEPFERRLAKLYEANPEDAPTIFRQELRTQAMSHLFFNAPLLDLVERILDTPELRLAGDFAAYPKRPRSALPAAQQQVLYAGGKSLWHAARMNYDQLNVSEELMEASLEGTINVWTPLVSTTKANGCVRVVPGSHRLDVLCMLPRQDAHSHPSKGRGYLEVDEQLMAAHENKAVDVELEPGDIFLFKQNLIHSGRPNTTDGVRWSMDWRYQDARRQNLNLNPELSSLARSASNPQSAGWSKLD